MTVAYEEVNYAVEDGVATITINRPEQLNALTDLTQAEIRHALGQSESNPDVVGSTYGGRSRILLWRRHERLRRDERSR